MNDNLGAVSMTTIGKEAIGILVLIVIWAIIPEVGVIITNGFNRDCSRTDFGKAYDVTDLYFWMQAPAPFIVLIVVLILRIIYDLKQNLRS
jgi:hypothetical protein